MVGMEFHSNVENKQWAPEKVVWVYSCALFHFDSYQQWEQMAHYTSSPKRIIIYAPTHQSQHCERGRDLGTELLHAGFVLVYFHWNDLHNTNGKGLENNRVVFRRGKKESRGKYWESILKMHPFLEAELVKKVKFKTVIKSCCSRYHQISYLGENTSLKIKQFLLRMLCVKTCIQENQRSQNHSPTLPYKGISQTLKEILH